MGGRRRPLDPEARAVTVRAIAGLAALNLGLRRGRDVASLWAARGLPRWDGRAAPFRARLPPRRRRVRGHLDTAPRRRRAVRRLGGPRDARRCNRRLWRRGRPSGPQRSSRPVGPPTGSSPLVVRHRLWHRTRRALARGALSLRAAPEPSGVRRLGVLGAEGEGDLLLRRARRADLHDERRPDVSADRPDPRRGGLSRDGIRRRRHVPPPVLVPLGGRRRGDRRVPLPARAPLGTVVVTPARPRRPSLRRGAPDAAGRRARRPALRGRRAAAHTLATRRSGVAPRVHRSPPRGCRSDEARRAALLRPRPRSDVRRVVAPQAERLAPARSRGRHRRRGRDPVAALVSRARHHGGGATEPRRERVAPSRARLAPALPRRPLRREPLVRACRSSCCSRSPRRSSGETGGWRVSSLHSSSSCSSEARG